MNKNRGSRGFLLSGKFSIFAVVNDRYTSTCYTQQSPYYFDNILMVELIFNRSKKPPRADHLIATNKEFFEHKYKFITQTLSAIGLYDTILLIIARYKDYKLSVSIIYFRRSDIAI